MFNMKILTMNYRTFQMNSISLSSCKKKKKNKVPKMAKKVNISPQSKNRISFRAVKIPKSVPLSIPKLIKVVRRRSR